MIFRGVAGAVAAPIRVAAVAAVGVLGSGIPSRAAAPVTMGFVLSTAVAPYGNGTFVVTDAALQRVFVVDVNGNARSLAGSGTPNALRYVAGRYRDGAAGQAQFNEPEVSPSTPLGMLRCRHR